MKFTGEFVDPTGLYYLRARQYDPTLGRFATTDPAGQSQSASQVAAYVYAANNVTAAVDPTGRTLLKQSTAALDAVRRLQASGGAAPPPVAFGDTCSNARVTSPFAMFRSKRLSGKLRYNPNLGYGYQAILQTLDFLKALAVAPGHISIWGYNLETVKRHQVGWVNSGDKDVDHQFWGLHTNYYVSEDSEVSFKGYLPLFLPEVVQTSPNTWVIYNGVNLDTSCVAS
jgi:RHS repeat-associated protein